MIRRIVLTLLVALVVLLGVGGWLASRGVNKAAEEFSDLFPEGLPFSTAEARASEHYPDSGIYSAAKCEREWRNPPAGLPAAQGGPCIGGITRIGQSGVMFRLAFDKDGVLKIRWIQPYYTFL
jgi:hypothetical protein